MTKVLLIGNGAREHAIAEAIKRSGCDPRLYSYMKTNNPGIASLSHDLRLGNYDDLAAICTFAKDAGIEFAIIGPEDPLQNGVVDALSEAGFPSVGPTRSLARLETSKIFTRRLLEKYSIPGNPRFKVFDTPHAILDFLKTLEEGSVIKPDGLTGGKGVMVQGDHFSTPEEALLLCETILKTGAPVLVEERLDGEEFSLQCFCDGKTVVATPAVQDHKRRFEGDSGPNTGGMGSYSYPDRSLPFLIPSDIEDGVEITRKISEALFKETGELYKGIMYGGFMATKEGVKLLEYNARFGDPEAMNVLPLIKSDFIEVCRAIIKGTLKDIPIAFEKKATVCKYVVPKDYGLPKDQTHEQPAASKIEVLNKNDEVKIYYSSVDKRKDGLYMTSSRAIGIVGIADTVGVAEKMAENAISSIKGPVDHRADIGTAHVIERRIAHMKAIRG